MNRRQLLDRIGSLVEQEHELRTRVQAGQMSPTEEQVKIRQLEAALDQSWDLLRRRHACRDTGQDPDSVTPRSQANIEGYLQ
ncbi:hypothetical protein CJ179_37230 [Rhodococcus sp. ACS1]|uniref:DUF2630 family protein n=1 Tax=Rhodococcus sp. ACS1 TaxID=2028570 RepID=UPI000BB121B4|nr:DUF2630 family protein [Rhodococcus sp. ACS1]PBC39630.1 hypothetical protein CJ179_37230 [Rhodococcus sp. ACS1]